MHSTSVKSERADDRKGRGIEISVKNTEMKSDK